MSETFSKSHELEISDNKKFCSFYTEYSSNSKIFLDLLLLEINNEELEIKGYDKINYISIFLNENILYFIKKYINLGYKEFNFNDFIILIKNEEKFNLFLESISFEVKNNVKNITNKYEK